MPTPDFPTNQHISHLDWIAIDTETFLIQPGRVAPPLVCVTTCEAGGIPKIYDRVEGLEVFRALVYDKTKLLVLHNAAFDLGVLLNADPSLEMWQAVFQAYDDERIWDTGLWDKLYNIKKGYAEYERTNNSKPPKYSLGACVYRWFRESVAGKSGEDAWRLRYHELKDVPMDEWPAEAKDYAMLDAHYTIRVMQKQYEVDRVQMDFWRTTKKAFALHLTTCRGLRTDKEVVWELKADLTNSVLKDISALYDAGFFSVKKEKGVWKLKKNSKLVKEAIIADCLERGIEAGYTKPSDKFPDGQVSATSEVLELCTSPLLQSIVGVDKDKKLLSTYIPALERGMNYPVCASYDLPKETNRSSSFRPNIQNQPRKGGVRECFVPRLGYIFVDADYSIAELRSLAQVLTNMYGQSVMADVIRSGQDIHVFMAAKIGNMPLDEFMMLKGTALFKELRQLAKACDFGAPGGLGAQKFMELAWKGYGVKLTLERAKELITLFKDTFPEMYWYFGDIGKQGSYGSKPTVIHQGSGMIRGDVDYCARCNTNFQELTASGALAALYQVCKEAYSIPESDLFGSPPVWFIHDEIGLEALHENARKAAVRLSTVMREVMEIWTPDIPCVVEADLRRRWYKDAEPTFDREGDLIPWSPKKPRNILANWYEKLPDDAKAIFPFAVIDEDARTPLDKEELQSVTQFCGMVYNEEIDKHLWNIDDIETANKMYRWELSARINNPDPWC